MSKFKTMHFQHLSRQFKLRKLPFETAIIERYKRREESAEENVTVINKSKLDNMVKNHYNISIPEDDPGGKAF